MDIELRASRLGEAARRAFQGLHGGRPPTMENDVGGMDVLWPTAWEGLRMHGALDSEQAELRQCFMDAYFFMAGVSAGG